MKNRHGSIANRQADRMLRRLGLKREGCSIIRPRPEPAYPFELRTTVTQSPQLKWIEFPRLSHETRQFCASLMKVNLFGGAADYGFAQRAVSAISGVSAHGYRTRNRDRHPSSSRAGGCPGGLEIRPADCAGEDCPRGENRDRASLRRVVAARRARCRR